MLHGVLECPHLIVRRGAHLVVLDSVVNANSLDAFLEQDTGAVDEDGLPVIGTWHIGGVLDPGGRSTLLVVAEDGQRVTLDQRPAN